MVGTVLLLDIIAGSVNVALLITLLVLYGKNLKKVRWPLPGVF